MWWNTLGLVLIGHANCKNRFYCVEQITDLESILSDLSFHSLTAYSDFQILKHVCKHDLLKTGCSQGTIKLRRQ